MEKVTAVIPVRKGSVRVPNKNFKDFKDGMGLLELKLQTLKKVSGIHEIIVNTDSDKAIDIAKDHQVSYFRRDDYYASSDASQSEFFENLAHTTDTDILLHTPCTSPFISVETYTNCINVFRKSKCDSLNTVNLVKEFLWLNGAPINYKLDDAPNSQDLPDIMRLNFGVNIIDRDSMLRNKNVVGDNPFFYILSDVEGIDIDYPIDFDFAKHIQSKLV